MYIVTVIRDEGMRRYGYSDRETAIRRAYEFAEGSFKVLVDTLSGFVRDANGLSARRDKRL